VRTTIPRRYLYRGTVPLYTVKKYATSFVPSTDQQLLITVSRGRNTTGNFCCFFELPPPPRHNPQHLSPCIPCRSRGLGTAQTVSCCVIAMVCEGLQVVALQYYPTVFYVVTRFSLGMGFLQGDVSLEQCCL
jgi:hypothetical protein